MVCNFPYSLFKDCHPRYNGCHCDCHRVPNTYHCVPCCSPFQNFTIGCTPSEHKTQATGILPDQP